MPSEENSSSVLGSSAQNAESLQLRQYWHTILERRWLIISSFTFVFVLAAIYAFKATPIYMASARIQRESGSVLARARPSASHASCSAPSIVRSDAIRSASGDAIQLRVLRLAVSKTSHTS